MIVSSAISSPARNIIFLNRHVYPQMGSKICSVLSQHSSNFSCFCPGGSTMKSTGLSASRTISGLSTAGRTAQGCCFGYWFSKQRSKFQPLPIKDFNNAGRSHRRQLEVLFACEGTNMRFLVPRNSTLPKIKFKVGPLSRPDICATAGLVFGLLLCNSSTEPVRAEAACENEDRGESSDESHVKFSHGKKVYADYSVIGIPGDGRCLFRSVAHGACLRSGKPAPSESLQRELADDLRARVADEFIKRREETEWFVEGDFDSYVSQMRKPHVWGGEPELFMASHVLQMPITVYMHDKDAGGLISIAEYGQEYGKENPIRVLYHGSGHYDALQIPGRKAGTSRL